MLAEKETTARAARWPAGGLFLPRFQTPRRLGRREPSRRERGNRAWTPISEVIALAIAVAKVDWPLKTIARGHCAVARVGDFVDYRRTPAVNDPAPMAVNLPGHGVVAIESEGEELCVKCGATRPISWAPLDARPRRPSPVRVRGAHLRRRLACGCPTCCPRPERKRSRETVAVLGSQQTPKRNRHLST